MGEEEKETTDEDLIAQVAAIMKDNAPAPDDKHNVHTFLTNVVHASEIDKVAKVGNLRDDKSMNELGFPIWTVRGALDMARISEKIMENTEFCEFFESQAKSTLITSLSREGFLIKQATTQTKRLADITKRRKVHKGLFGSKNIEESGGDTIQSQNE